MSALQELAEKLSQQSQELLHKLQDSALYQKIKEKYDDLPQHLQRLVLVFLCAMGVFFVFSFPFDNWSRSSESLIQFQSQRDLINELHQVVKESAEGVVFIPAPPVGQIKTDIEMRLQQFQLSADQMGPLQIDMATSDAIIPKNRQEGSIKVPLKKINLRQLVDIVSEVQRLHMGVKLINFKVDSNVSDPRYLDALLDFVVVKIPQINLEPEPAAESKGRKRQ
ncbi:MAG: hypothetical protein ACK5V3_17755 [Bdellovibrionales bacterium]